MTYQATALQVWDVRSERGAAEILASNWVEALGRALNGEVPPKLMLEAHGSGGVAISLEGDRWSVFPVVDSPPLGAPRSK